MPIFRGSQFVSSASDFKDSVRACSTTSVNLAAAVNSIDGVSLSTNDRVLLTNQNLARENGIYKRAANGILSRSRDADSAFEVTAGLTVYVEEGTEHASSTWVLTNASPVVVGTTALVFSKTLQISSNLSGSYGGNNKTVSITLSKVGSISAVTEHTLNTDNITEGSTNLFHTAARARTAISGTGTITYNSVTGQIGHNPATLTIGNGLLGSTYNTTSATTISIDSAVVATITGEQTLDNKTIDGGTF